MSKEPTEKITFHIDQPLTKQFVFQFKDGQKAVFKTDKDCQTMQDFLDRMNKVHELEKQLKEANMVIKSYIRNNPLEKYGPAEAYVNKWGVK